MNEIVAQAQKIAHLAADNARLNIVADVMQWLVDNQETIPQSAQSSLLKVLESKQSTVRELDGVIRAARRVA